MLKLRPILTPSTENEYPVLSENVWLSCVSEYEPERLSGLRMAATKLCDRFTESEFLDGLDEERLPLKLALVVPNLVARMPETDAPNRPESSPSSGFFSNTKLNECVWVYSCERPIVWSQNTLNAEKL